MPQECLKCHYLWQVTVTLGIHTTSVSAHWKKKSFFGHVAFVRLGRGESFGSVSDEREKERDRTASLWFGKDMSLQSHQDFTKTSVQVLVAKVLPRLRGLCSLLALSRRDCHNAPMPPWNRIRWNDLGGHTWLIPLTTDQWKSYDLVTMKSKVGNSCTEATLCSPSHRPGNRFNNVHQCPPFLCHLCCIQVMW